MIVLRVLHFSSHNEDCGIAKYQENYLEAISNTSTEVENKFFKHSPYQTRDMNRAAFSGVIDDLNRELTNFDILHIQHEFGFFRGDQLRRLVDTAKQSGKKVVVTYHTSPDLIIILKPLGGIGPRSIISYLRSRRHNHRLIDSHIRPLNMADKILVHNSYTSSKLRDFGIPNSKLELIAHPTYEITKPQGSTHVSEALKKHKNDIVIGTVGYLHRFKGVDKAIKSLSYLPGNYKLAILGGVKSDSDDQKLYDSLTDLIIKLGLQERVYITGVVPSDDMLNSYIRETDVCVYPYDSTYYKGVSSGALNLAIANERPIVAYPVSTLLETNEPYGQITFTDSDSYYELAREIKQLDIAAQTKKISAYADANSFVNTSKTLVETYKNL